jgi:O-antigen ligase
LLLDIITTSPLVGVGPANYYFYTPLFPIMGWYVNFNSHNQYFDLVLQAGFLGLIAFLWFTASVARAAAHLRKQARDGFTKAFSTAVLAGMAGSLAAGFLADWILPFIYNLGIGGFRSSLLFWVFLGAAVAMKRIVDRQRSAEAAAVTPVPLFTVAERAPAAAAHGGR